ncbi:MAG: Adenosine deaminase [Candidatus Beckwithbacteria bacterium GW2011_GWC2_47_9]|uniref:adenosine deaminase n=1 Tax=Candidatus Beckwithbacteria bacterium GW2011_GWC2_47_9 TaxID=1618373 RepID=A0A0G1TZS1_9BACT|nr:MAG: Adenosine deaminase [Candidatus Beckwithbacteria bacterium GW2011_GWC2_47_9]
MDWLAKLELTELHTHVGASVSPTMLWEMAHNQGIKLPTKDYWQFEKMITLQHKENLNDYLKKFELTELIQSSPEAMFTAMETAVSGAFRKNNITTLELRYNPIYRNRRGERDLDHTIVFSLQGMERAMLKYPVRAGVLLCMDRRLPVAANKIIVEKAIKYKSRGVIGIDLAGSYDGPIKAKMIKGLVKEAKAAGLGVTIHTGETPDVNEMWEVVRELKPDRIGHGIAAVRDIKLMRYLAQSKTVLEICPTSNINTKVVKDYSEFKKIFTSLIDHGVKFTLNTDGPEMQQVNLREEFRRLLQNEVLTQVELIRANETARKASFIND